MLPPEHSWMADDRSRGMDGGKTERNKAGNCVLLFTTMEERCASAQGSSKPFQSSDIPLRKALLAPIPRPPKVAVSNHRASFLLRVRIESSRVSAQDSNEARHDCDMGIRKWVKNALRPALVGHSVVVQVGNDLRRAFSQRTVSCPAQTRGRLNQVLRAKFTGRRCSFPVPYGVVDHNYFIW